MNNGVFLRIMKYSDKLERSKAPAKQEVILAGNNVRHQGSELWRIGEPGGEDSKF